MPSNLAQLEDNTAESSIYPPSKAFLTGGGGLPCQVFIKEVIRKLKADLFVSPHHDALKMSLLTHADAVPKQLKADLQPIIGRYMPL